MMGFRQPLDGITVLDLSRALAGPQAGMMLGDLGARVIKVENPRGGDDSRRWGPPFMATPRGDISTYFLSCNRNKESITLDFKDPSDFSVLLEAITRADVLIENFRPGTMDRLGLSTERLLDVNPRLIVLSISGFGHDGPEGTRAGYDQIAQGEAGLMSLTGSGPDDPQRVGVPIADLLAGIHGVVGVLAALYERQSTGAGKVVRTSLLASVVGVHAFEGTRWTVAGQVGQARGNHHPSIAPYGWFTCKDSGVQISVGSDALWERFRQAFGGPLDNALFGTNASRVAHRDQLVGAIESLFADKAAAELLAQLDGLGIPCGKVRSIDEVYDWEQTLSQGLITDVEHPSLGPIRLPGPPLRFFDGNGTETTASAHTAPPELGADNEAVRAWLGVQV